MKTIVYSSLFFFQLSKVNCIKVTGIFFEKTFLYFFDEDFTDELLFKSTDTLKEKKNYF